MKIDKYFHMYGKGKEIVFEEVPTIEDRKTGRWIPCSERLPGMGESVLVTDDGEEYFKEHGAGWTGQATTLAYMTEEGWEMCDINYDCQLNKITAWMPLPKPYKEAEHDNS